jgi:hypothetical protein
MMIRLAKHIAFTRPPAPQSIPSAAAGSQQKSDPHQRTASPSNTMIRFPERPDLTVLSETIPLFYIAQNNHGFWVAREAQACCGGVFLLRRSAVRFARQKSAPAGCAMMFLNEPFELDLANEGSSLVAPLTAAIDIALRRLPTLAGFVAMAIAEWRTLVAQISRAVAGERRNRMAIERELFHGHYRLLSKNDDDLPVP